MPKLDLTGPEAELLRELAEEWLADLRVEIGHTDSKDYREALKGSRSCATSSSASRPGHGAGAALTSAGTGVNSRSWKSKLKSMAVETGAIVMRSTDASGRRAKLT